MVVVQHAIASSADGSSLLLHLGVSRTGIIRWTLLLGCTLKYRGIDVHEIIWKLSKKNLNFRIIRYYIDRKTLLTSRGNATKGKKKSNKRKSKRRKRTVSKIYKVPKGERGWFYENSNFMATRPEGRTLIARWSSRLGIPCESRHLDLKYTIVVGDLGWGKDTVNTICVNSLLFNLKIICS